MHARLLFLSGVMISLLITPVRAFAGGGEVIIRDTEIETDMHGWTEGIFGAAGMKSGQVNIVLVQSPEINAFVAGGSNIFIYSGLIQKTENAGEIAGVIAHELGHIAGGHLTRTGDVAKHASFEAMMGAIVGIGAAIATGDSSAAVAGVAIGRGQAMNGYLAHSRIQESSADQAGYRFLTGANVNPVGLPSFLEKLASQELLPTSQQSLYARTHPMSRDRVDALEAKLKESPLKDKPLPAEWADQYARVRAKLIAFVSPQQVMSLYPSSDTSIPARYARAIASYLMNHMEAANKEIDGLLVTEPNNPYFWELKGQMLFSFGRTADSIKAYQKAIDLEPSAGLIRIALAQAMIEGAGRKSQTLDAAIGHLKRAEKDEPRVSSVKRLLATAYGKMGKEAEARVYLAEEALMQGRRSEAARMAKASIEQLPKTSPERIRASDIMNEVGDSDKKM